MASSVAIAQKTQLYSQPEADYNLALELYNKQKFGAAQKLFEQTIENVSDVKSQIRINSEYYNSLCALELFNNDAEFYLIQFVKNHADDPKARFVKFHLGKYQFRKKRYNEALDWFEKVDLTDLSDDEVPEYYFKKGYCYFLIDSLVKAKKSFFEIIEIESKYSVPTAYYYSHIAYKEKNYETALQGFLKLTSDPNFGPIIPYYIAQIYYFQGKYEEVIKYAPTLLDSANTKKVAEISRLLGESYYRLGKYKEALPYFEMYKEKTTSPLTREDKYELGYTYYRTDNIPKAIANFEKIVLTKEDTITQNTLYHLGDCYIKSNNKQFARNAFLGASKLNFDEEIKENALFNYAKLSYELALNPYNEALSAFQRFIKEYPNSIHVSEAYEFMVDMLLNSKNYKDALITIEKIPLKDEKLKATYQKITYYCAIELFNNDKYDEAIVNFNKSLRFNQDKHINASDFYWRGESYYHKAQYDSAIADNKSFIFCNGSINLKEYNDANYNIGYSFFKQKKYPDALSWFRKFIKEKDKISALKYNDALLRIGDCYYISKDYNESYDYYNKAAELKLIDNDYAMFQKAMCAGLQSKNKEKAIILTELIATAKESTYDDDAKYELGKTYQLLKDNEQAINYFKKVVAEYPNSDYVKKALSKLGLLQYNANQNQAALETFKNIVTKYPSTEESREALVSIRNIYVDMDDVESFFKYVKGLSGENVADASQDTISYQAAENRYMDGDCIGSSKSFANYLQKFPEGAFSLNANFYKAECDFKSSNFDGALQGYNFVINKPKNNFTENALMKASSIYYKLGKFAEALTVFNNLEDNANYKSNILESRVGIMRCNFFLKQYAPAIMASKKVLITEKISKEIQDEAHLTIAKSALEIDSTTQALSEFQHVAKVSQSEKGAEAKFNVAFIYNKIGMFDESEKTIFELINQIPSYDYWVARGFILLADNYVRKGNIFQAKHTLKSIIDNYDGQELVQIAQEKLNKLLVEEKIQEQKKAEEEINVKFNNDRQSEKLFEEQNLQGDEKKTVKKNENKVEQKKEEEKTSEPKSEINIENKKTEELKPEQKPSDIKEKEKLKPDEPKPENKEGGQK